MSSRVGFKLVAGDATFSLSVIAGQVQGTNIVWVLRVPCANFQHKQVPSLPQRHSSLTD